MHSPSDTEPSIPMESICILLKSKDKVTVKHALEYVLLMTNEVDKCRNIYSNAQLIKEILYAAEKYKDSEIGQLALNTIINVTGDELGATAVYESSMGNEDKEKSVIRFLKYIVEKNSELAEHACKILANMTIPEKLVSQIVKDFLTDTELFRLTFQAIHNKNYNMKGHVLSDYLSQSFGNLAQSADFQKYLLTAEDGNLFSSILSVICYGENTLQKRGIASTVYNCLFNSANHPILLNHPFNILPCILLPLAGAEEFEDEEVEKMPIELQYLEDNKVRESDIEVRKLLLKSLLMLCATKYGRTFLREKQTYLILREYHKWEEDKSNLLACENVVDVLIRTEEEIGVDNLKSLSVPDDLIEKFEKMDNDYINS